MRIALGTDLSEEALGAARWAFELAEATHRQKKPVELTILHVTSPASGATWRSSDTAPSWEDSGIRKRLERQIAEWLEAGVKPSVPYDIVFAEGNPVRQIRRWVEGAHVDWLVVGMTGLGAFARLAIGSTAHRLAQNPPCKIVVVHPEHAEWGERPRLMVGVDFLDSSREALNAAAELARVRRASLEIVHVISTQRTVMLPGGVIGATLTASEQAEIEQNARRDLDAFVEDAASVLEGVKYQLTVLNGYPTRTLIEFAAAQKYDGIVLGTVGRSVLDDFMLGSVASGVLRRMPTTLLLTPHPR